MSKHLVYHWPDMTGAMNSNDWVCIGKFNYRGKTCRTKYSFLDLDNEIKSIPAWKVQWKEFDRNTNSILANAIHSILITKGMVECIGTPVFQTYSPGGEKGVGQRIHMYDAGHHGTLSPRYTWIYSCSLSYQESLLAVLKMEINSQSIVGQKDVRLSASIDSSQYAWKAIRILVEGLKAQNKFSFYDPRREEIEKTVHAAINQLYPRFVDDLKAYGPEYVLRKIDNIDTTRKGNGYDGRN